MKTFFLFLGLCLVCSHVSFAKITRDQYQRAVDLLTRDQFDEAIAVLKLSLDQDPDQAPVYNLLGMIYLRQNESVQSAIGSFEQALRIDPNYVDAYFNLASTYAGAANRPELAAEYFKKTLEVDPKYVKAYFGLGWFTLVAQEKPEEAAKYFQKAIDNFPQFAEAYFGLGLSYVQMGKAPMALQSVSQLRVLGREDLAVNLESVLRGGKVPEGVESEARGTPSLENVSSGVPEGAEVSPGSSGFQSAIVKETPSEGRPSASESPDNRNPFQLN